MARKEANRHFDECSCCLWRIAAFAGGHSVKNLGARGPRFKSERHEQRVRGKLGQNVLYPLQPQPLPFPGERAITEFLTLPSPLWPAHGAESGRDRPTH